MIGILTSYLLARAAAKKVPKPIDYSGDLARELGYLRDPMSAPDMQAADRLITDASSTASGEAARQLTDAAARTGGGARSGALLKGISQAQSEVRKQAVDQRRQALMQTIAAIRARIAALQSLQAGGAQHYQSLMAQMELGKYQQAADISTAWKNMADAWSTYSKT